MKPFAVNVMNAIAAEGLELLGDKCELNQDRSMAQGLLVRSSPVELAEFPQLVAVARAGAGVNNIPLHEASAKGICVFNTPGANANAVVELVFTMLGLW
ncbi:MAG: 3-phosphoglycerate dehydrogenase, partial [Candidatus Electrothrix sp. AR3]|nr:3-phosphoglycerate dehydrogenase [Candidatus Electrothrix sp. AR3]